MLRPFPTTPERRQEAAAAMRREAPALMDDIAAIRLQFPGARLTHFKAGNLELGETPKDGWEVDVQLVRRVAEIKRRTDPEVADIVAKKANQKHVGNAAKLRNAK